MFFLDNLAGEVGKMASVMMNIDKNIYLADLVSDEFYNNMTRFGGRYTVIMLIGKSASVQIMPQKLNE